MHVPALAPLKKPAGHAIGAEAPSGQWLPAVHAVHTVFPAAPWKVPAAHNVHAVAPFALLKLPAGHGEQPSALVAANEPARQAVQVDRPPSTVLPAAHTVHAVAPVVAM